MLLSSSLLGLWREVHCYFYSCSFVCNVFFLSCGCQDFLFVFHQFDYDLPKGVCVCVCVCIHTHTCIYLYICVCVFIYIIVYVCAQLFSCVQLFVTPWTVACQAGLSSTLGVEHAVGFSSVQSLSCV